MPHSNVSRSLLLILGLVFLVTLPEAKACTAAEGYRIPTNYELVEQADLILLARVASGPFELSGTGSDQPRIVLEPLRVLKGTLDGEAPRLFGATSWNNTAVPSMPTPLHTSHFSAGLGACIRMFYPVGGLLIAMFENGAEGLVQIWAPWSRAAEDVEGAESVWVRTVEEYLTLQRMGADRAAIEARRDELRATLGNVAAQAMAFDLDHYLRVTGGNGSGRAQQWVAVDMPRESGAVYWDAASTHMGLVRCADGMPRLEVEAVGAESLVELSLVVDGRSFDVSEERVGEREGRSTVAGAIPIDSELLHALHNASAELRLDLGGRRYVSAPPSDVVQKLSMRCQSFAAAASPTQNR